MPDPTDVLYEFRPAAAGDHLIGVPARDLTRADWEALSPAQQRDATAPGPSGEPLYRKLTRREHQEAASRAEPAAAAKDEERARRPAARDGGGPPAGGAAPEE